MIVKRITEETFEVTGFTEKDIDWALLDIKNNTNGAISSVGVGRSWKKIGSNVTIVDVDKELESQNKISRPIKPYPVLPNSLTKESFWNDLWMDSYFTKINFPRNG